MDFTICASHFGEKKGALSSADDSVAVGEEGNEAGEAEAALTTKILRSPEARRKMMTDCMLRFADSTITDSMRLTKLSQDAEKIGL